MNKFKISHLKAKKKDDIYALCLKEFGNDTASTYKYYTKAEMIDDLMTVQKADKPALPVPSEAVEPEPQATEQLEIMFVGFYQSYHAEQPSEVIEQDIDNALEDGINLADETIDKIWDNFNGCECQDHKGFNWCEYFGQVANEYARFVLATVLDPSQDLTAVIQGVEVDSPREYNFVNDKIYAKLTQRPLNLTLDYFQANNLIDPLMWFIKSRHSSRDGYISFVNPNPTLGEVFATNGDNPYIDCAMYVLTCHAFELDPYKGYSYNANELDNQFISRMIEGGYYDDIVHDCTPAVCFDLLQGNP